MSKLVVAAGQTIQAAHMNTVSDQSVTPYTSTAERDSSEPSPAEGQCCYIAATDQLQVYRNGAWRPLLASDAGGSFAMTADLSMGNNRIIALTAGSAGNDAVNMNQLNALQAEVDDLAAATVQRSGVGLASDSRSGSVAFTAFSSWVTVADLTVSIPTPQSGDYLAMVHCTMAFFVSPGPTDAGDRFRMRLNLFDGANHFSPDVLVDPLDGARQVALALAHVVEVSPGSTVAGQVQVQCQQGINTPVGQFFYGQGAMAGIGIPKT